MEECAGRILVALIVRWLNSKTVGAMVVNARVQPARRWGRRTPYQKSACVARPLSEIIGSSFARHHNPERQRIAWTAGTQASG